MAEYKLQNVLPHTIPGETEDHYGYKCDVRRDGVYIQLDEISATNFLAGNRIVGPVVSDKPVRPVKEPEVVEEVEPIKEQEAIEEIEQPQTMTDVMENGSGKRAGRPAAKKG